MRFIALIFIVTLLCSCSDVVSSHYATYEEAREDKLFLRGWLPDILPSTTTNISTSNNLDLNTSIGQFILLPEDALDFTSKLTKMSRNSYSYQGSNLGEKWIFTVYESGKVTYELNRK